MDAKIILKTMAKARGVTMTDLALRAGVTRRALYHRMDHQMKLETFNGLVEAMGGTLYVAFPGTNAKKLSFYDK